MKKYTPDMIYTLKPNEVFVFGSNLAGKHYGGAARIAHQKFGAVWGQGVGLQGQSYAIPTMHGGPEAIHPYVTQFINFAKGHNELTFYVTPIGCGIAGFTKEQIAPLFKEALEVENIILPKNFVDLLTEKEVVWDSEDFLKNYKNLKKQIEEGNHTLYHLIKKMRVEVFSNTRKIIKQGYYTSANGLQIKVPSPDLPMITNSRFYTNAFSVSTIPTISQPTQVEVINKDCLEVTQSLLQQGYNPAVLNMASRRNPGGGVMDGAGAQEETLFRRSNLYRSLYQFAPYASQYDLAQSCYQYPLDKNFGGVYSPHVFVFRLPESNGYALMENPFHTSVISVAAINRPPLTPDGHISSSLIEPVKNKIRTIFRIGLKHGHDSLVLGALGCGAFCNPPEDIARFFHEVMQEPEFANKFKLLCFAILEDHNSNKGHNRNGNFKPFEIEFKTI